MYWQCFFSRVFMLPSWESLFGEAFLITIIKANRLCGLRLCICVFSENCFVTGWFNFYRVDIFVSFSCVGVSICLLVWVANRSSTMRAFHCFTFVGACTKPRVARWLSPKYRTLVVPAYLAQTIELFTHVLCGITINIIPDKEPKYRTVRLSTGHLATPTKPVGDMIVEPCKDNLRFSSIFLMLFCIKSESFLFDQPKPTSNKFC